MYSILPLEHIHSMDNCHLAMCSREKKAHLLNECMLVQHLEEEIHHNTCVHFTAEHSIHRECVNTVCFRWLSSSAYQHKPHLLFTAYPAKYSLPACELLELSSQELD